MAGPVIITRAEPGNSQTAARLAEAGVLHICAPMLELVRSEAVLPALGGVQGLLFTSANGVRAFCEVSPRRDICAWCVGPATLASALEAGFLHTEHADGNAADLADLVMDKAQASQGKFVHVANAAAAGNMAKALRKAGFEVDFAPLYEARRAQNVPKLALKALKGASECTVLLHSAKGAAAFGHLTGDIDMRAHIMVAVSKAAGEPLAARGFGQMIYAERPNETALLDALFRAHSTL